MTCNEHHDIDARDASRLSVGEFLSHRRVETPPERKTPVSVGRRARAFEQPPMDGV